MNLVFAIAIYFVIWWTVLFAVLPLAGRTQAEARDVVPGTPPSAPESPRYGRVIVINTLVSALIFAIVYGLFASGLVSMVPELAPPVVPTAG